MPARYASPSWWNTARLRDLSIGRGIGDKQGYDTGGISVVSNDKWNYIA